MGSGGSKAHSTSSSSNGYRGRSKGKTRLFKYSCLGMPSGSRDGGGDDDEQIKEKGAKSCTSQTEIEEMKTGCYRKVKLGDSDEMPSISSSVELDNWGEASINNVASRSGSTSARASSTRSLSNNTNGFFSRFSFIPGNASFRLSRASSLGSSGAYHVSSSNVAVLNNGVNNAHSGSANSFADRIESRYGNDLLPASLSPSIPMQGELNSTANLQISGPTYHLVDDLQRNEAISSTYDSAMDHQTSSAGVGVDVDLRSPRTNCDLDSNNSRFPDRRIAARESTERNVQFSRTLSVGRLRDRVLRRTTLSDLTFCPSQQEREVRDVSPVSGMHTFLNAETRSLSTLEGEHLTSLSTSVPSPSVPSSLMFGFHDYEVETSRPREARYHDLLEHRSTFLERRRRIRSQVRALRRLGSRFENFSGHERACILSGQHRTGRCTCRLSNHDANLNDETGARASISRIVMLAEALFEVLDEIHQQSVVLSSQPSVSSIGSVPAPNEVVDSLPIKIYSKSQKHQHEDVAQCYICLLEYEEGDAMRILPCNHEYHRTCVDKWLKEIHRVCPLCRGDICRSPKED